MLRNPGEFRGRGADLYLISNVCRSPPVIAIFREISQNISFKLTQFSLVNGQAQVKPWLKLKQFFFSKSGIVMKLPHAGKGDRPKFDNNGQYSRTSILRYEKIFGDNYVSTGGAETTEDLCARLGSSLRPGARVLDVGSGLGGAAFHLSHEYGAKVTGIDLAEEMVAIALERAEEAGQAEEVTFILGDVLAMSFPFAFDIIWSRDALMSRLYNLLEDGGRIVITDYARGKTPGSAEFEEYIVKTGYHVIEPEQYGQHLRDAGFVDVVVDDATATFVDILRRESHRLSEHRSDFLAAFSPADLEYLVDRWAMKDRFCQAGDMKWGIYLGTKRL
jgi:phosphoethanolamine N-methyltransferase